MSGARTTMDITPVRLGDRWLDDGKALVLWADDDRAGLRLHVTTAGPLVASRLFGASSGHALITFDAASGDLRAEDPGGVLEAPVDLDWLRRRLDPELREAIAVRARRSRENDRHAWKDGDCPRVSIGERVRFCDVFPQSWDVLVTLRGRRYALIDRYLVDEGAKRAPIGIEVIDLERGEPVSAADVEFVSSTKRRERAWRPVAKLVDQLLLELRRDPAGWRRFTARAEEIARVARRLRTWDADRADPEAAVRAALPVLGARDGGEDARDRVTALGARAVPSLQAALSETDAVRRYQAASLLVELGDASGAAELAAALLSDEEELYGFEIVDDLVQLGERAFEPLLEALQRAAPERRFVVMEALVALRVRDDRLRDLLIRALETDGFVASLLAEYGDDGPPVVEALARELSRRLDLLAGDPDDDRVRDEADELAESLRDLGALAPSLEDRVAAALGSTRGTRPLALDDDDDRGAWDAPAAVPVRAVVRPGRNEPCWCGSNKKYKKCHLEADEAARLDGA